MTTKTKTKTKTKAPAVSFFGNAKPVEKKAKSKSDNKQRLATKGLLALASFDAVIKALTAMKADAEEIVKDQMRAHFVKVGTKHALRPENYIGTDDVASASLELRKRASNSPLNEFQAKTLADVDIELKEHVTYSLNEDVLTDDVMALVEKALNGVDGIPPNLFTVHRKFTVTDEALTKIFTKGEKKASELIGLVSTLAIKPKVEEDFSVTVKRVMDIMTQVQTETE